MKQSNVRNQKSSQKVGPVAMEKFGHGSFSANMKKVHLDNGGGGCCCCCCCCCCCGGAATLEK